MTVIASNEMKRARAEEHAATDFDVQFRVYSFGRTAKLLGSPAAALRQESDAGHATRRFDDRRGVDG
jgi:hypothetical protein